MGSCRECTENWAGDPPCSGCEKPDNLLPGNVTAWQAWTTCNSAGAGRDGMTGRMRIEAIIAVLDAMGGTVQDMDRVLLIESIHQEQKPKKKNEQG